MGDLVERIEAFLREHWKGGLVVGIFLLALWLRLMSADIQYLKAFDPFFQLRYTEAVVEKGLLPQWDVFSYYPPGRPITSPPLLYYVTGYLYLAYNSLSSISLMSFAKYASAVYAALSVFPAYLLGKELSGKEAGIMSAFFLGVSPAILSRTMAGFYDTDALVMFFSVFVAYLFVRLLKRVDLEDLTSRDPDAWREVGLTTLGVALFSLAWRPGVYISVIAVGSLAVYGVIVFLLERKDFGGILRRSLGKMAPPVLAASVGLTLVQLLGYPAWNSILFLISFAQDPSQILIVNVSVAELQNINIFANNMQRIFARISVPAVLTLGGSILLLKRDKLTGSFLLTWAGLSFFAITQGVRFMLVFAPAASVAAGVALGEMYRDVSKMGKYAFAASLAFLVSVLLALRNPLYATGLVTLMAIAILFFEERENLDSLPRALIVATMVIGATIALSQASQLAISSAGSGGVSDSWEEAYSWMKANTAEDAVVGTWWDPGHQITYLANRRVIADGAHCGDKCSPGLNTRISDLGFIFSTSNERAAAERLMKYRGNASEMYWIASRDLVGKFRWLQYFGTGCDGTGQYTVNGRQKCPLYARFNKKNVEYNRQTLEPQVHIYDNNIRVRTSQQGIPVAVIGGSKDGGRTATFENQIIHRNGEPVTVSVNGTANQTASGTIWIHPNFSSLVYIPDNLKNSMFTEMYFLGGKDLELFEKVFDNGTVKIFRLKMDQLEK